MRARVNYLTLEQVLVIHLNQIETYGSSHGLRDQSLLESALYRPQTSFAGEDLYSTIFLKAACLMESLILNHPFVDDNKRTGIVAALTFLEINRVKIKVSSSQLENLTLQVEQKAYKLNTLAKWFQENSVKKN